jgi:hypothetical protein
VLRLRALAALVVQGIFAAPASIARKAWYLSPEIARNMRGGLYGWGPASAP